MQGSKHPIRTAALGAVLAAGAMFAIIPLASADVACNSYGECWHVKTHYRGYPRELGIHFYRDDWAERHRADRRYHWMEDRDSDRGYYSRGEWHEFAR